MKYRLLFINLRSMVTKNPIDCLVIIILELFSIVSVILSYGVIRNVFSEQEQETIDSRIYSIRRNMGENGIRNSWSDSDEFFENYKKMIIEYGTSLSCSFGSGNLVEGDNSYLCSFAFYPDEEGFNKTEGADIGCGYAGYVSGEKAVKISQTSISKAIGDTISIDGSDYVITGVTNINESWADLSFYFTSMPKTIGVTEIYLIFKEIPSHELIEGLNTNIHKWFGNDFEIFEPEIPDLLVKQFGMVSLTACSAIMLIVVFNCVIVYLYIFEKRKKWISVIKLCGCKNIDCIELFIIEASLVTVMCSLSGLLITKNAIIPRLEDYYVSFKSVYNLRSYICLFFAYVIVSIIMLTIAVKKYVSKTVDSMRKEAN